MEKEPINVNSADHQAKIIVKLYGHEHKFNVAAMIKADLKLQFQYPILQTLEENAVIEYIKKSGDTFLKDLLACVIAECEKQPETRAAEAELSHNVAIIEDLTQGKSLKTLKY